ncbi:MAG: HAD-IB family phosphatase [Planctomycetota bacterium]|nr:HAD-IB family phosphatase [Planctomycetota bacterium]
MTIADQPPPYDGVVFDCDSTLSRIEGIEELARIAGAHLEELRRLTAQAMDGNVPLEEVYGRRLVLVEPSRGDVARVGERYVEEALPNAGRLVAALRALGKRVAVVSGGVTPAVARLAAELGVEAEDVYAVDLVFDESGGYAGFDEASPLARAGGKIEVLRRLAAEVGGPLAFVGDGATDLEAAHLAARFVAFGGVERRAAVFDAAAVTCADPDLAALVPLLLTEGEIDRLRADEEHAPLVHAAGRFV